MLSFALDIRPVKASMPVYSGLVYNGPICILANGSVTPSSAPIKQNGSVYTLIGNINNSIVVERGNITIDGGGYTLQGNRSYGSEGIHVSGMNNVTIKNLKVMEFWCGICLYAAPSYPISGNNVTNNNVTDNDYGIYLEYASDSSVSKNIVTANHADGLTLYYSSNNIVSENDIKNNNCGFSFVCSSYNKLRSNDMKNNTYCFSIDGIYPPDFVNDVDVSNTVDHKPIYYWVNESDRAVPLDAGYVALVNCTRIAVQNLTLSKNIQSVLLAYTTNSSIIQNTIGNDVIGICFFSSPYNHINGNNLANNTNMGIFFLSSSNNSMSGNKITNSSYGVSFTYSSNNSINGNSIVNTEFGFNFESSHNNLVIGNYFTGVNAWSMEMWSSYNNKIRKNDFIGDEGAILVYDSAKNLIEENNLMNTHYGIGMSLSSNNSVSGNHLSGCTHYGVWLYSSSNNSFYHNNFINNTLQVQFGNPCTEFWDDGYPSAGNYWSSYTGIDLFSGSGQNQSGSDGIGDTSYSMATNNRDNYPLMAPFHTFTAGIWNSTTYYVDIVSNSTLANFSFNATSKTITFSVEDQNETIGFCRVAIPTSLLSCGSSGGWIVMVNGTLMGNRTVNVSGNYTYIYFSYTHSTHQVTITGTNAVPEFPSAMALTLILVITLFATILLARKRNQKPKVDSPSGTSP